MVSGIRKQVTLKVQEVNDRTMFHAFSKIHPDRDYLEVDLRKKITYNSNEDWSVVLVIQENLKDMWNEGDVELRIERHMRNQRLLNRMSTLNMRALNKATLMAGSIDPNSAAAAALA